MSEEQRADPRRSLRFLPPVDGVLEDLEGGAGARLTPEVRTRVARRVLEELRRAITSGEWTPSSREEGEGRARQDARRSAERLLEPHPRPVINAAGVVLHTNLGRAPTSERALQALHEAARGYSDLEYDLERGGRGSRLHRVEELLCALTGAEAAVAVNNNAAAVLLALDTLASGREAVVSRGHLVEIGGSFRMPEVVEKSGAVMVEVGTTNKTHLHDYAGAITSRTALFLHVHQSNFVQKGFVSQVPLSELCALGAEHGIPVVDDQGSGVLVDAEALGAAGEPTVLESLEAGAGVVTWSGDKLLGGPQAGIVLGRREHLAAMKENPLARALRLDKLQLAALEATLCLYLTGQADREVPARIMARTALEVLEGRARLVRDAVEEGLEEAGAIREVRTVRTDEALGGGSSPDVTLPGWGVAWEEPAGGPSAAAVERALRRGSPPVVCRVSEGRVILSLRSVFPSQDHQLAQLMVRAVRAASGSL
ncbi:MAG: L-seryl-tRNA(Sec) selenium transferase [bacterium]